MRDFKREFSRRRTSAKLAGTVDGVTPEFHFDAASFQRAMQAIPGLARIETLEGDRDMLAVFDCVGRASGA
jgi:hypothetical protein